VEESRLYQKLDEAIQRLTDVSHEIKQVLVVHETKLEQQEDYNNQMYDQIQKLHKRIGDLRDELMKKVDSIEKWRWILVGGALTLGALLGNSKLVELFGG
jgi:predicted  nucleic acid-binding Zn-ribbon protein